MKIIVSITVLIATLAGGAGQAASPAQNVSEAQEQKPRVFRDNHLDGSGQGPSMVVIPGQSMALGQYEVTVGEYLACVQANGCPEPQWRMPGGEYHYQTGSDSRYYAQLGKDLSAENSPIVGVNWHDAQAYARWLSRKTGQNYRLPTGAEWRYACLANQKTQYCGGNNPDIVAWHKRNSGNRIHPAGQKKPNAWGLYDMSGNVGEWQEDSHDKTCDERMLCGGDWLAEAKTRALTNMFFTTKPAPVRLDSRYYDRDLQITRCIEFPKDEHGLYIGFRIAKSQP